MNNGQKNHSLITTPRRRCRKQGTPPRGTHPKTPQKPRSQPNQGGWSPKAKNAAKTRGTQQHPTQGTHHGAPSPHSGKMPQETPTPRRRRENTKGDHGEVPPQRQNNTKQREPEQRVHGESKGNGDPRKSTEVTTQSREKREVTTHEKKDGKKKEER